MNYTAILQEKPPGAPWRFHADLGSFTSLLQARRRAQREADDRAGDQVGGWRYRVAIYKVGVGGEPLSRPSATVYPSQRRAAWKAAGRRDARTALSHDPALATLVPNMLAKGRSVAQVAKWYRLTPGAVRELGGARRNPKQRRRSSVTSRFVSDADARAVLGRARARKRAPLRGAGGVALGLKWGQRVYYKGKRYAIVGYDRDVTAPRGVALVLLGPVARKQGPLRILTGIWGTDVHARYTEGTALRDNLAQANAIPHRGYRARK